MAWVRAGRVPDALPPVWSVWLALSALGAFLLVATLVVFGAMAALDNRITVAAHAQAGGLLDAFMRGLTTLGAIPVITAVVIAIVILLLRDRRRVEAVALAALMAGEGVLDGALKLGVHRGRPHPQWSILISGFSFPSGHAMATMCLLGMLLFLFWPRSAVPVRWLLAMLALFLVLGVGVSRVYLGVHYASDVVGGWLAGVAWLGAVFGGLRIAVAGFDAQTSRGRAAD